MKLIITFLFLILNCNIYSQDILIFKPDSECGKDASMSNSPTWDNGNTPISMPSPSNPALRVEAWTAFANGSPEHDSRSIIEFEELKNIQSADVNSATLILYAYPDFPYANGGQAEVNTAEVYRVIEPWEEDLVSWAIQPDVASNGVVEIPQNNSYDLIEVDVTEMVQTMIDNPDSSFGFLLRQKDESPYGSMDFASSDYPDLSRAPELIIDADNIEYLNVDDSGLFSNADTTFCTFSSINLEPDIDPNLVMSYLWSNGSTEESISVDISGIYWVNVKLGNCIYRSDTINVTSEECENSFLFCEPTFPNAFTPDGDGVNDSFGLILEGSNCYFDFELKIFNRWGNLVFESNAPSQYWDGKVKGALGVSDVYIYYLTYSLIDGNSKLQVKGDVSLIR